MGNGFSKKRGKETKDKDETNYIIKINDSQIDRIQQLHHVLKGCCNDTNYFSPISQNLTRGIEVLDIGSGPGTWIFDMSSDFPKSNFTGVEMQSSMLPANHPGNTKFVHKDILQGAPFPPNAFHYVHMRSMVLCFTELQFEQVIRDLVNVLKPNGYLELCEAEVCSKNMGPISERLSSEMGKLLKKRSMNPFICDRLHGFMDTFGLQQIQTETVMLPLSELDGELGALYGQNVYCALFGVKDKLAKQMKISNSQMKKLLNDYIQETKYMRMYVKYTRIYGIKP